MRIRKRLWVVTLLALLGICAWFAWPRHRALLDGATPIADVSSWRLSSPWFSYHWLTPQDILFAHPGPGRKDYAERLNTITGIRTPLSALTQLLWKSGWIFSSGADALWPSPDGRWLLWMVARRDHHYYYLAGVDGSHFWCWRQRAAQDVKISWKPFWLPDSRHWVFLQDRSDLSSTSQALIYNIDSSQTPHIVTLSLPLWAECSGGISEIEHVAMKDHIQTSLVCEDRRADNNEAYILRSLQMAKTNFRSRPGGKVLVPIPVEEKIEKALFDSHGQHILWIARSDYTPPYAAWLHRFMPSYQAQPQSWYRFWISGPSGNNAYEIGQIKIKPDPYMGRDTPYDISWLPDGKRVSFIYRNTLYTVPVE